jgi:ribonuclease HI
MPTPSEYHCYTDGACKAADGAPGGWGFVIRQPGQPSLERYGSANGTLAKVMEYRAVAEALLALPPGANATVFSDNRPLIENMQRNLANWQRCEFANVDESIVLSARSIDASIREKQLVLRWQWLRAHNGNTGNERADALAAQGAREAKAALVAQGKRRRR